MPKKKLKKKKNKVKKEEVISEKLNLKQNLFCEYYSGSMGREYFGNGLQSYAAAYNLNLNKKGKVNTAKSNAYVLLTNTYILARVRELIKGQKLTEEDVDSELEFLIKQSHDFTNKLGAIKEFNKLKQRVVDKIEHTGFVATSEMSEGEKKKLDDIINKNATK
ncbi:MAG: hypothetical protein WC619_01935 [Patescibacteria group bacterium]